MLNARTQLLRGVTSRETRVVAPPPRRRPRPMTPPPAAIVRLTEPMVSVPVRLALDADLSPQAMGQNYPKFVEEYKKAYNEAPISGYHANAYDGAMLAMKAIEKVAKTDKDGNLFIGKKALRDAVFATKFDGISGPIACDQYGECSQFKPSVLEFTSSDPKTFGVGKNPKKIWP